MFDVSHKSLFIVGFFFIKFFISLFFFCFEWSFLLPWLSKVWMWNKSEILALWMEHVCPDVCLLFEENFLGPHLNLDYRSVLSSWFCIGHFKILSKLGQMIWYNRDYVSSSYIWHGFIIKNVIYYFLWMTCHSSGSINKM